MTSGSRHRANIREAERERSGELEEEEEEIGYG